MQWSAVDLCGSAPECRLDFATCTLRLRLPAGGSTESTSVSHLKQADASLNSQQPVVPCSGTNQ